jgi:hypothetical protein
MASHSRRAECQSIRKRKSLIREALRNLPDCECMRFLTGQCRVKATALRVDVSAAKEAFADLLGGKTWNANQIEFVNLVIDHLTENGAMDPALLYSSPYTDFSPHGLDGVFTASDASEIVTFIRRVSGSAAA